MQTLYQCINNFLWLNCELHALFYLSLALQLQRKLVDNVNTESCFTQ